MAAPHPPSWANKQDWRYIASTATRPEYIIYDKNIQKSPNDFRTYRLIQLENGLEALLVHDDTTDAAGASLDVGTGQLMDPDDMPGMAHFCEHMSFLGTKQYPIEGEYASYISANAGYFNAYTDTCNTTYMFSVSTSALPGALDRFSTVFHSPLFTPSATMRELQAVDSEHKKNEQNDIWRVYQVMKSLSRAGHKWSKFGNGNMKSLTEVGKKLETSDASDAELEGGVAGRETQRRLVEWWSKEYCAGRMKLTVYGKETLEELTDMTVRLFSPIQNKGVEPYLSFSPHPYGDNERGSIVSIKALADFSYVDMTFPIPYQAPYFRTKPTNYIGYVIGHQGAGSLSLHLQKKGWAHGVYIDVRSLGRDNQVFGIYVTLTPEGLVTYREVVATVHKFIELFRTSPLLPYIQKERLQLNDMWFRFAERSDIGEYVQNISKRLRSPFVPRDLILREPCLAEDLDPEHVSTILESMRPELGRVVVVSNDVDHVAPKGEWEKEKWYGTEYKVIKTDDGLLQKLSVPGVIEEFSLPKPNNFISSNLNVGRTAVSKPATKPELLRETELTSLWHKKDDQFWVPLASINLAITSPLVNATPQHATMVAIYIDLVTQDLAELTYDASIARLSFDLEKVSGALVLRVEGYNEKLAVLLRCVLEKMKSFTVDHKQLDIMKQKHQQRLARFSMSEPYRISDYTCHYLLANDRWTHEERLKEIPFVTLEDLQRFSVEIFSRVHIRGLAHGNITKEEALSAVDIAEGVLKSRPLAAVETLFPRSYLLPPSCNYILKKSIPNKDEVNSTVSYFCAVGPAEDRQKHAVVTLLAGIIHEHLFKQLRTVEQLGYNVKSGVHVWTSTIGFYCGIQSVHNPSYCEERLEVFLDTMAKMLQDMSDDEFRSYKSPLIERLSANYQNLNEEQSSFWSQIQSGYNDFHQHTRDVEYLRHVTHEGLLEMFMERIHPDSIQRRKISVQIQSQQPLVDGPLANAGNVQERTIPATIIDNIQRFKAGLTLSKAATPV